MTKVSVKLVVGIPSPAVLYYALGYGGTFNGGVKCSPAVEIDMDVGGSPSLNFPTPSWGATHRYRDEDTALVAGKPDWYRSLTAGAQATENGQLQRTVDNLNASFVELPDASHAVRFWVVGANPLLNAPAIDADITVGLRHRPGGFQYRVSGAHDGFPNYSISINGLAIYEWDCVLNGETPGALAPPMDRNVNLAWRDR